MIFFFFHLWIVIHGDCLRLFDLFLEMKIGGRHNHDTVKPSASLTNCDSY